jgi:cell wall-associated NlpC family hydrolase
MLSFIISNVLIVANAAMGVPPVTLQNSTADLDYQAIVSQAQTLTSSGTAQDASRDDITTGSTPVPIRTVIIAQMPTQGVNSALVNSAFKYIGVVGWDCTMLVEQSLRDLGKSVPDLAPMGFGSYGEVFSDPNQVQPGDIMMRSGHVAIYAGNGMAIHGGYHGIVQVVPTSPSEFYEFVRI